MLETFNLKIPVITEIKRELEKLTNILISIQEKNLPKFLAMESVVEIFKINKQTLNRLVKDGKLEKYKLSDRKIYFATEEIYSLIEQNQVKEFVPNLKTNTHE